MVFPVTGNKMDDKPMQDILLGMNIEEMVPELFEEEKKVYYCQRCLNHGEYLMRKGHKTTCKYKDCQCSDCIMVERRRQLSNRLVSMESSSGSFSSVHSSSSGDDSSKIKERRPNCQRCAQHGVTNRLKGHKRACPFKECICAKCMVVVERQKLMADQIKLRRRQKREKSLMAEKMRDGTQSPTDTENGAVICETCTQQALTYQQLMAYLDPSGASESVLTLAAVLQACPHQKQED